MSDKNKNNNKKRSKNKNTLDKSFDLKMMATSFDPFSKLENIPRTPKQRYEIMTEEMPKTGKLSLEMMYQTCGTQINLDYILYCK